MNRFSQAAGLAAVLVVVIGGGLILSQRNQPATGGPATSPSVAPAATGTPLPTSAPSVTAQPSVAPVVLRTFPVAPPDAQGERSCDAIGVDDPVVGILDGDAALLEDPVWLSAPDGGKLSIVWPAGFTARFSPAVVLYDDRGVVVARAGDTISLQWNRSTAAGSFDDPYYASGMLLQGCYPRLLSPGSGGSNEPAALVLQRAPANLGCDAIGIEYDIATIHIDPNAEVDVWAETRTGRRLAMYWSNGFSANDGEPPVIRDPAGGEIARDGTVIDIKHWQSYGPWNRYFLCPGPDTLYVLETAPQ